MAFRSARAISKIDVENEHSRGGDVESKLTVGWRSVDARYVARSTRKGARPSAPARGCCCLLLLPREHLHDTITSRADNEAAVLAPHDGTHAFSTHDAMAGYHLCADTLLQAPEADAGIVAGGDGFATVFA